MAGRIGRGDHHWNQRHINLGLHLLLPFWLCRMLLHRSQFRRLLILLSLVLAGAAGFLVSQIPSRPRDGTGLREESLYFIKTIFLVAVNSLVLRR
jgi:hypothetical protein